jgi:hypothetical protein
MPLEYYEGFSRRLCRQYMVGIGLQHLDHHVSQSGIIFHNQNGGGAVVGKLPHQNFDGICGSRHLRGGHNHLGSAIPLHLLCQQELPASRSGQVLLPCLVPRPMSLWE